MDTAIIVALIVSFTSLAGIVLQIVLGQQRTAKLDAIHVLVNSRLDEALKEIKYLKGQLETEQ